MPIMCGVNKLFLALQYFQDFWYKPDDFKTIKNKFQIISGISERVGGLLIPRVW